jgi:hypothetical protein
MVVVWIFVIILLFLLLIGGYFLAAYNFKWWPFNKKEPRVEPGDAKYLGTVTSKDDCKVKCDEDQNCEDYIYLNGNNIPNYRNTCIGFSKPQNARGVRG